jgi:ergothioneine biosynthesis protein EgtB
MTVIATYQSVRHKTEALCQPLQIEDFVIQSVEDTSPPKWHLAHTTWFFETFLLIPKLKGYRVFHPEFNYLFNSYYHSVNLPYPRAKRGLLSRPTVKTIFEYRRYVDNAMLELLSDGTREEELHALIQLGLNHEQQHQELLLMDIKHNFFQDKSFPYYQNKISAESTLSTPLSSEFKYIEGGIVEIGHAESERFCFDNELPRHRQIVNPFLIDTHLTTNQEYLEFIEAGGYKNSLWWLSDGWDAVTNQHWQAPLYWVKKEDEWFVFTLHGLQKLNLNEPLVHVSFYEADAYARWRGKRLPLEAEWEHCVEVEKIRSDSGRFLEKEFYHPQHVSHNQAAGQQFFGDVWEWTASPYAPYPGYKRMTGALGEYNGKFMSNQLVLKGGSCVTPASHIRSSYRNFFQPDKRWQFSGIRLASDA